MKFRITYPRVIYLSFFISFILINACKNSSNDTNIINEPNNNNKYPDSTNSKKPITDQIDKIAFKTNLYEYNVIGLIKIPEQLPFIVFSGRDCNECDANIAIYIHSLKDSVANYKNGKESYSYPGVLLAYNTNDTLSITKTYYGEVLKNTYGIIWYETTYKNNKPNKKRVFLVEIKNGKAKESVLSSTSSLNETLLLNNSEKNKEIKGHELTSEP